MAPRTKSKEPRPKSSVLTPKQEAFVDARSMGLTVKDSMSAAGMSPSDSTGSALMDVPKIREALSAAHRKNAYMLGLTRESVLEGMMEAIDQAKLLADPMTQVAGWREIAKICGFYAPEVKKVEITGANKRVLDQMRQLSDAELLQIESAEIIDVDPINGTD